MATTTAEPAPIVSEPEVRPTRRWLVSPLVDMLFIANLTWPLVVLMQLSSGLASQTGLPFWQIYFVTTPHRWITLLLVFLDQERFAQRRTLFLLLAGIVLAVCISVQITTGTLLCLLTIDYLWNAWHFAAQHQGIYRIYGRMTESAPTLGQAIEKWLFRGFLLYVTLRIVTATGFAADWESTLLVVDWFALLIPVTLVINDLLPSRPRHTGRTVYLASVNLLYTALLWSVHERWFGLILALTLASALFHATEYLAIVSWSVHQRHASLGERLGPLGFLAARWGLTLALFVLILGMGAWLMEQHPMLLSVWLTLNVAVAFLHYAYDGLIWRRRAS